MAAKDKNNGLGKASIVYGHELKLLRINTKSLSPSRYAKAMYHASYGPCLLSENNKR